jgi:polysaccharide biosynthesis/export protein
MTMKPIVRVGSGPLAAGPERILSWARAGGAAALIIALGIAVSGCETSKSTQPHPAAKTTPPPRPSIVLKEGDVVKITFPGASSLDNTEQIRQDGEISLSGGKGDYHVAGMTPTELRTKLLDIYDKDIVTKDVNVVVVSSVFPLYVQGTVMRPGKITPDHPVSVLDALMEAGGYDPSKSDLRHVKIIRQEGGNATTFKVDVKAIIDGEGPSGPPFELKPGDIIVVPERFTWF